MPDAYDYITLMCRLKAAQTRNKELESDERYIQLKKLHQKEYRAYEHKIQKLKAAIEDALDKVKELRLQFYETAARLEEEQGKNLKLRAQINRDYENSSIPSSKTINRKKIANRMEEERLLRNYKRKQAQAVTFRSFESIDYLCQCMSMLILMRLEEPANIFDRVSKIFG